jgi:hypothetical protein
MGGVANRLALLIPHPADADAMRIAIRRQRYVVKIMVRLRYLRNIDVPWMALVGNYNNAPYLDINK